jgi:hypothetical protein
MSEQRTITVTERAETPWLSIVLGYGPMLPFVAGALAAWTLSDAWRNEAIGLTLIWATAILTFLAGVRRGLSFRTEGGPAVAQIATMFVLFVLALGASIAVFHGSYFAAALLALGGFATILATDPIAARRGQAPLFFARLRPPQISIAVVALVCLAAAIWLR